MDGSDEMDNQLKSRRLAFIEACAYYIRMNYCDLDGLAMSGDLAALITSRLEMKNLHWAVAGFKNYEHFLIEAMHETLPDFDGVRLNKEIVLAYNFRSLVAAEVRGKAMLFNSSHVEHNEQSTMAAQHSENHMDTPTSSRSATQLSATVKATDFLQGFMVFVKPDVHLDENVPICARDQHLLHNIFGEQWAAPAIVRAYLAIKGETGFMHNWSHGE